MNLGRYEIDNYSVSVGGVTQSRQKITYIGNNGVDIFVERYFGYIREGYKSSSMIFKDLLWSYIKTHVVGETIVIVDSSGDPQIYISLSTLSSVDRSTPNTLIIIDSQYEPIYLEFLTDFDCDQALSLLDLVLENPNYNLNSVVSEDETSPIIYLNETLLGANITIDGLTPGPFSSDDSEEFQVTLEESLILNSLPLTRSTLLDSIVYEVVDNRGTVSYGISNIKIYKSNEEFETIDSLGEWVVNISIGDLASNSTEISININII